MGIREADQTGAVPSAHPQVSRHLADPSRLDQKPKTCSGCGIACVFTVCNPVSKLSSYPFGHRSGYYSSLGQRLHLKFAHVNFPRKKCASWLSRWYDPHFVNCPHTRLSVPLKCKVWRESFTYVPKQVTLS